MRYFQFFDDWLLDGRPRNPADTKGCSRTAECSPALMAFIGPITPSNACKPGAAYGTAGEFSSRLRRRSARYTISISSLSSASVRAAFAA